MNNKMRIEYQKLMKELEEGGIKILANFFKFFIEQTTTMDHPDIKKGSERFFLEIKNKRGTKKLEFKPNSSYKELAFIAKTVLREHSKDIESNHKNGKNMFDRSGDGRYRLYTTKDNVELIDGEEGSFSELAEMAEKVATMYNGFKN